jgi:hypothetical protein
MESSHLIGEIILEKFLKIVGWVLGSLVAVLVILSALFAYWYLRSNRAHVDTGVVIAGDTAYISYYTSPIDRDYSWILGMLTPSAVRMAKVDLLALEALANQAPSR